MIQGTYDIGTGEVFYRKHTHELAENTARHKANQPIKIRIKLIEHKKVFSHMRL